MKPMDPTDLLIWLTYGVACVIAIPLLLGQVVLFGLYDIIRGVFKRRLFIRLALFLAVIGSLNSGAYGGIFTRTSHAALVAKSGIRPHLVGTHEGVGVSSQGYAAARSNACFWGKRQALTVQYSKRGGLYYAVVRYR